MPEPSLSFSLLSLFTTPEKAMEIEGDLIEQAGTRGPFWFGCQVALTSLALFRASMLRNFFVLALMSYAAYELCTKAYFYGIRPLRWYLRSDIGLAYATVTWLTYLLVAMLALTVGGCLVRWVPKLGAQVAIGAVALVFLRLAVLQEGIPIPQLALCAAVPMLAGALLMNRLRLRLD